MTVYIGVDFHARQQTISYLTTEDGEIKQQVLEHEQPARVRAFYQQFAGQPVVVGFESSGYAAWFEELLEELGCEICIGHAADIRRFARRRQKNDRRDAALILDLVLAIIPPSPTSLGFSADRRHNHGAPRCDKRAAEAE